MKNKKEEPKQDRTCTNNCSVVCGECQIFEPKQETLTYTEAAKKEERIFNSTMISKQETLEEAAERLQKDKYGIFISKDADVKGQLVIDTARAAFLSGMTEGAKWQAEQIPSIIGEYLEYIWKSGYIEPKKWFEQFKKK